jgi:hypothetical protein
LSSIINCGPPAQWCSAFALLLRIRRHGHFACLPDVIYTLPGPMVSVNLRLFRHQNDAEVQKMGTKQTQQEIQQLKEQLKAAKKANDSRLLRLALVLAILAAVAGILQGRIQLW